jgi:hypothetical protein
LYVDDRKVAVEDSMDSMMAALTTRVAADDIASIYLAVRCMDGLTAVFHQNFELSRPRDRRAKRPFT